MSRRMLDPSQWKGDAMLQVDLKQAGSEIAVYSVAFDGLVCYVGRCKLRELFRTPDAISRPAFAAMLKSAKSVILTVHLVTDDREASAVEWYRQFDAAFPILNGARVPPRIHSAHVPNMPVVDLETGEIFANASEACAAFGINPGNMSKHLRSMVGFTTVAGRRFQYATL